mmetsp:Transcript_52165/g.117479  ORF Transcript_52165/g.117479 Transcript_52165/m.117479 type:complete len:460 (+) Transcript_52165:104-1483(+)
MNLGSTYEDALPVYQIPCNAHLPLHVVKEAARLRVDCLALHQANGPGHAEALQTVGTEEDVASHFAVRAACSAESRLCRWFIDREVNLFRSRWAQTTASARAQASRALGLLPAARPGEDVSAALCKLHFSEVPPGMLGRREVELHGGFAEILLADLEEVAAARYKNTLMQGARRAAEALTMLEVTQPDVYATLRELHFLARRMLDLEEEHRERTSRPVQAAVPHADGVGVSLDNFEELLQSFPPCMKRLVLHQRFGKHLKLQGRLQLLPFLRDAGMDISSAHHWWQRELCRDPAITPDIYRSRYAYQIEHGYGRKGHGCTSHTFSCKGLMAFPPSDGEKVHGCPFTHMSVPTLRAMLESWGLHPASIATMVAEAAMEEPLSACATYFQASFPGAAGFRPAGHPNEYLKRSCSMRPDQHQRDSGIVHKAYMSQDAAHQRYAAARPRFQKQRRPLQVALEA